MIKLLLIPCLNHLLLSLPGPNEKNMKEINGIFFTFLWETVPKIRRTVIYKERQDGGLKMINIKAFLTSLKTTWIRRLCFEDHN